MAKEVALSEVILSSSSITTAAGAAVVPETLPITLRLAKSAILAKVTALSANLALVMALSSTVVALEAVPVKAPSKVVATTVPAVPETISPDIVASGTKVNLPEESS